MGDFERRTLNVELFLERKRPFQPIQLCLVCTLPSSIHYNQRFGQRCKTGLALSHSTTRLSQQGKKIRPHQLCPCGPVCSETLAYLGNPFFSLSLLGERPAPQHSSHGHPLGKPVLRREGNGSLGLFF